MKEKDKTAYILIIYLKCLAFFRIPLNPKP